MRKLRLLWADRSFRLYLIGYGFIFFGAWAMSVFNSMVPMAMGAAAALMLSAPLWRQRWKRLRRVLASAPRR